MSQGKVLINPAGPGIAPGPASPNGEPDYEVLYLSLYRYLTAVIDQFNDRPNDVVDWLKYGHWLIEDLYMAQTAPGVIQFPGRRD